MYETDRLPPELRPLSPWTYFGLEILYLIPVIGVIFLLCHAIGSSNVNKRNFACSHFCGQLLVLLVVLVLACTGALTGLGYALGQYF